MGRLWTELRRAQALSKELVPPYKGSGRGITDFVGDISYILANTLIIGGYTRNRMHNPTITYSHLILDGYDDGV
jgi:hypothetical protein